MSALSRDDIGQLRDMVNGFQQTCVLAAALQIGLVDRIRKAPVSLDVLASSLGAHPLSLKRLVLALKVLGIVEEQKDGVGLTARGRVLSRQDVGIRDWAVLVGEEYLPAWTNLRHSIMTGENAFAHTFNTTAWEHRRDRPHLDAAFNRVTSSDQVRTLAAILSSYDFSVARRIADVGGGRGDLMSGLLQRLPLLEGILFDQPHVVEGARSHIEAAGLGPRCQLVGGSFLESVPRGADTYLMKAVLHNWDDEHCITILRNCAEAMDSSATLLVLEYLMPDGEVGEEAMPLVMLDLHMLAVLGGQERTRSEYEALFAAAGLRLARCIAARPGATDILEVKRLAG